jgi:hypothetical protein
MKNMKGEELEYVDEWGKAARWMWFVKNRAEKQARGDVELYGGLLYQEAKSLLLKQ